MTLFAFSLTNCAVAAEGGGRRGAFHRSLLLLAVLDSLATAKDDPAQFIIKFRSGVTYIRVISTQFLDIVATAS